MDYHHLNPNIESYHFDIKENSIFSADTKLKMVSSYAISTILLTFYHWIAITLYDMGALLVSLTQDIQRIIREIKFVFDPSFSQIEPSALCSFNVDC